MASELINQLTIDKGISTLLSFAWILLIVWFLKSLPEILNTWRDMSNAIERQNEVTTKNSEFIDRSMAVHLKWEEDLIDLKLDREKAREEREAVKETIKSLTAQVEALKEKIDDKATKDDVVRIEQQIKELQELIEHLIPFLPKGADRK